MMPTHLQCIRCGSRFYTAAGCRFVANHTCQTCGGRLTVRRKEGDTTTVETDDGKVVRIKRSGGKEAP